MKNLGRILVLLTFITNILNAGVTASVDAQKVVRGEMVTLSLKLDGKDVKEPNIQSICGEDVISRNSQTSIEMINGDFRKNYVLSYKFLPQKNCTIEPIAIEVGSKTEYTQKIDIEVTTQKITKDSNFILTLESSKDEVFVGESFEVTLLFKQKDNASAVDSNFTPPSLNGFWVKDETKPQRYKEGDYTVTKVVYTLAAQREGTLKISQAQMKIASRLNTKDSWGYLISQVKWRTYFSNELEIQAKKVPEGIDLVGEFEIDAQVDKSEIGSNEAVNLSISLKGDGNLEDIKTLKPSIEGVSIFDEKVEINGDLLTQKIAFVSDKDFVIPSISLRCFDPKTKQIKTIMTKEFKIKVKGSSLQKSELNIKRDVSSDADDAPKVENKEIPLVAGVLIFLGGLVTGVLIMLIKRSSGSEKKDSFDIKDEKKLLIKLLAHQDDAQVKEMMDRLEANIYSDTKEKIDKKELKELLKRLGIS
jgi:hypothetical protein